MTGEKVLRLMEAAAVACLVNRTRGKADFGMPFKGLTQVDVRFYSADARPLCARTRP